MNEKLRLAGYGNDFRNENVPSMYLILKSGLRRSMMMVNNAAMQAGVTNFST